QVFQFFPRRLALAELLAIQLPEEFFDARAVRGGDGFQVVLQEGDRLVRSVGQAPEGAIGLRRVLMSQIGPPGRQHLRGGTSVLPAASRRASVRSQTSSVPSARLVTARRASADRHSP